MGGWESGYKNPSGCHRQGNPAGVGIFTRRARGEYCVGTESSKLRADCKRFSNEAQDGQQRETALRSTFAIFKQLAPFFAMGKHPSFFPELPFAGRLSVMAWWERN